MTRSYTERFYRRLPVAGDLGSLAVRYGASDLHILLDFEAVSPSLGREIETCLAAIHGQLETWIARDPVFGLALDPHPIHGDAPAIVREMAQAAETVGVGPMASVAGAIAGCVGRLLVEAGAQTVMIENGGDLYLRSARPVCVGIFAGDSPFSLSLSLEVDASGSGVAVCSSSGTVGPSLSLGRADAAVVVSQDPALADAAATGLANRVTVQADIQEALGWISGIPTVRGAVVIAGDHMGAWGDIALR